MITSLNQSLPINVFLVRNIKDYKNKETNGACTGVKKLI